MSDNDIALAERRQQILTIEPAEYVAQVFEPFTKRLASAIAQSKGVPFDVTTTIGMATAKRHRALFRDLRVESEEARKERKAPILEIGRLLDSRAKEIKALIDPHESHFDDAIKAEEARKEAEKQAKLEADRQRVNRIQAEIQHIRCTTTRVPGNTASIIAKHADALSERVISVDEFMELTGDAIVARDETVALLREMAKRAAEREESAAALAAERAELARLRMEQEERDRLAAAARAEEGRKAREAQEKAAAALRAEQAAHDVRMAEQRAELARQQAEIDAERRRQAEAADAARRVEQARQEATDRAQREQEAEAQRQADEQRRVAADEQRAREKADFERDGPTPQAIIHVLTTTYALPPASILAWLRKTNWKKVEV